MNRLLYITIILIGLSSLALDKPGIHLSEPVKNTSETSKKEDKKKPPKANDEWFGGPSINFDSLKVKKPSKKDKQELRLKDKNWFAGPDFPDDGKLFSCECGKSHHIKIDPFDPLVVKPFHKVVRISDLKKTKKD